MKSQNTEIKNYKLGIYEKAINSKFDWIDKFNIAKEAGFDFIEISIDESDQRLERLYWSNERINNLHSIMAESGMYINSMCLSANRRYPLGSKDPEIRKKGLDVIQRAMVFAKKFGIRIIQLAGYDEYYQPSDDETKKMFINNMRIVCSLAQFYSIQIAFESMDTFFMGNLTRMLNIINLLDSPMLGAYPDIGNLTQFAKENFDSEIELARNKIVAFHFKDTTSTTFKNIPFGEGTVDFVKSFISIFKINYCGPFMIEMWNKNSETQTMDENINEIKEAKNFFENKYKEALDEFKKY